MAQVAQDLQESIDRLLDYLIGEWEGIPEVAREWETWNADDQLDFVLEWDGTRSRLRELEGCAQRGLLTKEQHDHYEALLRLVAENQPLLEQLLRD